MAASDTAFDLKPLCLINQAGAAIIPELPGIRARTQRFTLPVATQHRARRHVDRGQAGTRCTHQQRRSGLVTAPHEHCTVNWVTAQQLFDVHRQQVAVKHSGGLDVLLG